MNLLAGWGIWYAPGDPQAFLNTLHTISGGTSYLIHSSTNATLEISGTVLMPSVVWRPDAFNFVGFPVVDVGGPTFSQFFAGSKAHQHNKIYRLANGLWRQVLDPSAETIRAGEAFWIYCDGASSYQGPIRAKANALDGMALRAGKEMLELHNDTVHPVAVLLEHVPGGGASAPLSIVVTTIQDASPNIREETIDIPSGDWQQNLPSIEVGRSIGIPLETRREAMTQAKQESALKITTDLGTVIWVPVSCLRDNQQGQ